MRRRTLAKQTVDDARGTHNAERRRHDRHAGSRPIGRTTLEVDGPLSIGPSPLAQVATAGATCWTQWSRGIAGGASGGCCAPTLPSGCRTCTSTWRRRASGTRSVSQRIGSCKRRSRRCCGDLSAARWDRERRVVAKVEWHPGELYPRVGFLVTTLRRPAKKVVAFYNGRGTAE